MAENCQQAERISNIINTKKSTLRHIIIKLLKTKGKERNLGSRVKQGILIEEQVFE